MPVGVIIVGAVVIPAQHRQVVHVRLPTAGPGFDVVDFAVIGSMPAIRHRARGQCCPGEVALFLIGEPFRVVQVHRTCLRVEQCHLKVFGVMVGQVLRTSHRRAIRQPQDGVITLAAEGVSESLCVRL